MSPAEALRARMDAIEEMAHVAARVGFKALSLGVDDLATAAIAEMHGAHTQTGIYRPDDGEPYAIDSASVTRHGVSVRAQSHGRAATLAELDAPEDAWRMQRPVAFSARTTP